MKSLRDGKVQIAEAFARIDGQRGVAAPAHIAVYEHSQSHSGHDETRKRKLLLHSHEIDRLKARVDPEHLSLIPLSVYFKDGRAKVELALARGRKTTTSARPSPSGTPSGTSAASWPVETDTEPRYAWWSPRATGAILDTARHTHGADRFRR